MRGGLIIQGFDQGFLFFVTQVFQDVGDIGRVQLRQPVIGDFQLNPPRRVRFNQVHKFPLDDAVGMESEIMRMRCFAMVP